MFTTSLANKSQQPLADRTESPGFCQAQLGVSTRIHGQSGRCSGRRKLADLLLTVYYVDAGTVLRLLLWLDW